MYIGLAWDFHNQNRIDLDASLVMLDEMGSVVDAVYYNKLFSDNGAIYHSGDQRDGTAEGYDEKI